jgi:hypothetical protein
VTAQLDITGPDGGRRLHPVPAGGCVIGSGPPADVVLPGSGILPAHLRLVRTERGYRVEPVRPGSTVRVSGDDLFCKDLRPGDVIELGGNRLRWLVAGATPASPPPVAPAAAPAPAPAPAVEPVSAPVTAGARSARRARPVGATKSRARLRAPRRRSSLLPMLAVFASVLLLGVLAYGHFRSSTWPASPKHYVDLARAQFGNNQPQRALDTLAFALREATGAVREEALQLEADIRRVQLETAVLPKVLVARQEHDLLLGFVGRYLRERAERPAAREFVRGCDQWLARHREVCSRSDDGRPLLAAIEAERSRYVAVAELATPDTAVDVLFAAESRLRFQWRDYRGAIAKLDAFLRENAQVTEVAAARARMVQEGEQWLLGKLRIVDQLLARGDRDNAERDLEQLERWSVLPEWLPLLAERQQRLRAGR